MRESPHVPSFQAGVEIVDFWTADIKSAYDSARRDSNLTYGSWKVVPIEGRYEVQDLKGQTIVDTASKSLAELVALLPDLCDPDLRPPCAPGSIVSSDHRTMPLMGVVDVQKVHDQAYLRGFKEGAKKGWEEAHQEERLDERDQ